MSKRRRLIKSKWPRCFYDHVHCPWCGATYPHFDKDGGWTVFKLTSGSLDRLGTEQCQICRRYYIISLKRFPGRPFNVFDAYTVGFIVKKVIIKE